MDKKSVTKLYSDGFIIRKPNCRIVCLKKDDGWEIHTQRYMKIKEKTFPITVSLKRNVLRSYSKYSEDSLLEIAMGINMFNNRNSYLIDSISQNPNGETIMFETTFTIKK